MVTAAHCVHGLTDKEADDVWVRVGDHDNSDPEDTEVSSQQRMFLEFLNFYKYDFHNLRIINLAPLTVIYNCTLWTLSQIQILPHAVYASSTENLKIEKLLSTEHQMCHQVLVFCSMTACRHSR